jgi:hypothetical protein
MSALLLHFETDYFSQKEMGLFLDLSLETKAKVLLERWTSDRHKATLQEKSGQ